MSNKLTHILGAAAILTAFSLPGLAQDSIAPLTFNATIPVGTSTSVNKVVTVGKVSKPVDIMFLLDSTGSMGGTLTSIASQFSSSTVPSANSFATDVQFGVGNYKDVGDPYVYQLNQDISASDAAAQAALTALTACCGGDTPEGQVYALQQAALTTTWRPGSQRILIWVGDAPGHDPRKRLL